MKIAGLGDLSEVVIVCDWMPLWTLPMSDGPVSKKAALHGLSPERSRGILGYIHIQKGYKGILGCRYIYIRVI